MIRSPYPVPMCPEHKGHHQAGCADCQRYNRNRMRLQVWARKQDMDEGQKIPADETRERLNWLRKQGMSVTQIAEALGLSREHVGALSNGRMAMTTRRTAKLVAGLEPAAYRTRWSRDSAGTIRRVQALSCMGYSFKAIANMYGDVTGKYVSLQAVHHWTQEKALTHAVADAIVIVYDKVSMIPCEDPSAGRVARQAKKKGWAPPLAWDDETIDDPKAKPDFGRVNQCLPDEAAVLLALSGKRHLVGRELNNEEKRLAIERACELGLSDSKTAELVGIRRGSVCATRLRMRERAEAAKRAAEEAKP